MSTPASKLTVLVRPLAFWLALAGLAAIAASLVDLMIPIQIRSVVNRTFENSSVGIPWKATALLGGFLVTSQLFKIGQRLLTEWPATRIGAALFQYGTHHLLSYPMSWFDANHSGAVQVRLERSTRAVADLIKTCLSDILPPVIGVVMSAGLIWHTNRTVGIVTVLCVSLLILLTVWQAKSQAGIRIAINRAREDQGVRVAEAVLGIEQVKLFRAEFTEAERAGRVSSDLGDKEFRHHKAMAGFDTAKFLIDRAGFGIVLIFALALALQPGSTLGPGGILMLVMLYERIAEPVKHLHRILDETNEKWILAHDYFRILENEPVTRRPQEEAPCTSHEVLFDNVSFSYASRDETVLREVTFRAEQGSKVAVVGVSGSGKSTLLKLLTGLYSPLTGRILVGGRKVEAIEKTGPSVTVGMLSQDIYIFAGRVADNISYGCPNATDNDIRRASEIAGLAESIDLLEGGYNTQLGQHGTGLSGGQKQRLALARVILQDPDVLILDEPSSSLDPETARRFFQKALQVFAEKTVLVITHDLINLGWADQVVVLENGHIQEVGSPERLTAQDTAFRRLRDGSAPEFQEALLT